MNFRFFLLFILLSISLLAESISTNLTDPSMIEIYHDVTTRIRCICLPSLPIKSCSYNNCAVSAELKVFIENRIKKGDTADAIVYKLQYGFGEEVLTDPVIQKFYLNGSSNMVNGVVYGFGDKILAEPSAFFINLTIILLGIGGLLLIIMYFKKNSIRKVNTEKIPEDLTIKYLKELD